jgi:DNA (cytosine-5)-methyltransferase 1
MASFAFIDLFAGIGGFRLAAERAGGHCVFSSEWDPFAQKTYEANYGEVPFGDITKDETKGHIPKQYTLLCAGFPCQPFSYAGLGKGFEETRGTLFFDILQILERTKPPMFLLENVKGLVSHNQGKTLKVIEHSLENLGYHIQWKILNSYDFGLPQYRERWYCAGFLEDPDFHFPVGDKRGSTLKQIIDKRSNSDPKLRLTQFELDRIQYHFAHCKESERVQHDNSKYRPNTKKGKYGVFSFQKPDGSLRFHVGDFAKTQIQEAFYACQGTYAPTIIANRVPKLWDLQRHLSVLEAQRLQGFPDDFKFPVSDGQAYKQLGNSVAVPVLQAIIEQMIQTHHASKRSKEK